MSSNSSISKSSLIELLTDISNLYQQGGDKYRASSFRKAVVALSRVPDEVLNSNPTKKQLMKYRNIKSSSADAIIEYIRTGEPTNAMVHAMQSIIEAESREEGWQDIIKEFQEIHGVGFVTAKKWYDSYGWRSIEHVKENIHFLNFSQRTGLAEISSIKDKIPREEIAHYEETLNYLFPNITWTITGSYRLGCPYSGSIDLLVKRNSQSDQSSTASASTASSSTASSSTASASTASSSTASSSTVLEEVTIDAIVDRLRRSGSLVHTVGSVESTFIGYVRTQYNKLEESNGDLLIQYKGQTRRLNIHLVDADAWPFALLYSTGSAELRRIMTEKASLRFNWELNQYSLTTFDRPPSKIPASSEREIFELLEMEYLEPTERNIEWSEDHTIPFDEWSVILRRRLLYW